MKTFKSNLTRIRGLMVSKLPDESDLFGFQGVSREMLLRTCDEIYALANQIEARESTGVFEIIALKRFEDSVRAGLSEFMEKHASSSKAKDRFNEFLNAFSALYEKTKMVYFIVNQNGLRNDQEIENLRSQIEALTGKQAEYEGQIQSLRGKAEEATSRAAEIESALQTAIGQIESHKGIAETASKATSDAQLAVSGWHSAVSKMHSEVTEWHPDIKVVMGNAKHNEEKNAILVEGLEKSRNDLDSAIRESAALTKETGETHKQNQALIKEIQDTLADANRVGMGGSFEKRMLEMEDVQKQWKWIFVGALILFAGASLFVIWNHLTTPSATFSGFLLRLPLITPLVWLSWFAARQYGFANRVREDYAFKYSSAMAYEGYKKAVRESNAELEATLIQVAIYNMSQNPIRLYDPKHADHASPFSEAIDSILRRLKGIKASASSEGVEAEAKLR